MYVVLFFLFLLAVSIVVGIVRKLRGGSFLPEPAPGEDRHFNDKSGRWWRQSEHGTFEEAFRRPRGVGPAVTKAIVDNTLRYYGQLFLWLVIPAAILAGLAWLSTTVAEVGVPGWMPWVCGAVAYLLILRYGRRRGWF
jgi:hypothetical protein